MATEHHFAFAKRPTFQEDRDRAELERLNADAARRPIPLMLLVSAILVVGLVGGIALAQF